MKKDKISSKQQGENALLMPEVNREGQTSNSRIKHPGIQESIFKYAVKSDLELDGLQQHIKCHSSSKNRKLRLQFTSNHENETTEDWKMLPSLVSLHFCCNIWIVGSEFNINKIKPWLHPGSSWQWRCKRCLYHNPPSAVHYVKTIKNTNKKKKKKQDDFCTRFFYAL